MKKAGVYLLYGVLAAAMLTVATPTLWVQAAPATPNVTTITANGAGFFAYWTDSSNPSDPVFAYVQVIPVGGHAAALPYAQMWYGVSDQNGTLNDSGAGYIPASAVSSSGGSVIKGSAVIKLNVDTCTLPTTEFTTFGGPCGAVEVTATEIPGFTYTTNGTTTFKIGTIREVTSGTTQSANALGGGNVVGYEFSSSEIAFIGIDEFSGVSVQITRP